MEPETDIGPLRRGYKVTLALSLLLMLFSCTALLGSCATEVARVDSPDGNHYAILTETNGGATTDFGYRVDVVSRLPFGLHGWSRQAASGYGTTRSECAYGINMRWLDARTLELSYFDTETLDHESQVGDVRIKVRDKVDDATALCGGMLYNLKDRPHD